MENYKIISLGFNCLPRIITTYANLKPRKKDGELTCVFDLAVHNDLQKTINLLKNDFENYFEGLQWNKIIDYWRNPSISSLYIHDKTLSKEEFIEKYTLRINNFKEYFKSELPIFFVYSTESLVDEEVLVDFYNTLKALRTAESYLIVINHGEVMSCKNKNILIINENWKNLKNDADWPYHLRIHEDEESKRFYDSLVNPMKKFIDSKIIQQ